MTYLSVLLIFYFMLFKRYIPSQEWYDTVSVNPFKPNGFSHSYQLEQCISVLRAVGIDLFCIQSLIEQSVTKQWRPLSDAAARIFTYETRSKRTLCQHK